MSSISPYDHRSAQRAARLLASPDRPLFNDHRFDTALQLMMGAVSCQLVTTEWGNRLPHPEMSFALLENLMELSPQMGRLGLRLTVDEMYGCWSLPLPAEYDSKKRARYPTVTDTKLGMKGTLAHRYVWRVLIDNEITSEEHLDHLCRTHACCNPMHLEVVTLGKNTQRGNAARHIINGQRPLFHPEKL